MEIKNMQYWKRKATLPGLNYEMDNKLPDGRSKSSALQKNEETKEGKATVAASKKGSEKLKRQEVTTTQTKPTTRTYTKKQTMSAQAYEKATKAAQKTKSSE